MHTVSCRTTNRRADLALVFTGGILFLGLAPQGRAEPLPELHALYDARATLLHDGWAVSVQWDADTQSHADPDDANGPQSCIPAYVWRNALAGDLVCVSRDARDFAQRENVEGKLLRTDTTDSNDARGNRNDLRVIH